jgi:hypothetical protein
MNHAWRHPAILVAALLAGCAAPVLAQSTANYPNFCSVAGLTLNGDAATLNPNGQCVLRMTNDLGQSSSVFLTNPFSLASNASFSTFFSFRLSNSIGIGDQDGPGADGIVFAVQTVSNTAGGGGGGIGYEGISPSVGIELDTFNNGAQDQNNGNHMGIDLNGNMTSLVLTPFSPAFNNGNTWFAWVDYDGTKIEGRVAQTATRPLLPTVSVPVNLVSVLGTTNAFVGFTSGTGSGGNTQDILSWQLIGDFSPIQQIAPPPANLPTLSWPLLALLAAALAGTAILVIRRA